MLVLTRKINESIMIGDNVSIKVVDVKGESAKIGIEAPKNIPVYRKEIYEAILKENIEASQVKTEDIDVLKDFFNTDNSNNSK